MAYNLLLTAKSWIHPGSRKTEEVEGARHQSIHATNVIALDDNKLLIAWFGGTREKHEDTAIWGVIIKSLDFPAGAIFKIAKIGPIPHWNPILFKHDNKLFCFFKVGFDCSTWRTWVTESENGYEWSRPYLMVDGDRSGRGPTKCKPILMSNGIVIAPGSSELDEWVTHFDRLIDDKWTISRPLQVTGFPIPTYGVANGIIQPAMWESQPGYIHALMRSSHNYLFRTDSSDYGETWCEPYVTWIPNNNSGIDVVKFDDHIALVYNPVGINWGPRSPLSVVLSDDNGITWYNQINIDHREREFSYPSMIYRDGKLIISYTDARMCIGLAEITISKTQSKILVY